jgi:vacuolar protein sorting-associated protein 52
VRLQFELDLGDLDDTTEDFELETIDSDLARFRQHPYVKEALDKGVDLRSYADELGRELREVEVSSVVDYVREAGSFAKLYREISSCEEVLSRLQRLLKGFRGSLEGIGEEISKLKNETTQKKHGLANRT